MLMKNNIHKINIYYNCIAVAYDLRITDNFVTFFNDDDFFFLLFRATKYHFNIISCIFDLQFFFRFISFIHLSWAHLLVCSMFTNNNICINSISMFAIAIQSSFIIIYIFIIIFFCFSFCLLFISILFGSAYASLLHFVHVRWTCRVILKLLVELMLCISKYATFSKKKNEKNMQFFDLFIQMARVYISYYFIETNK